MTVDRVAADVGIAKASLYKLSRARKTLLPRPWCGCRAMPALNRQLPAIAVLYTLYTRACDPVLEFLKMGGQHSDEQIGELVRCTLF